MITHEHLAEALDCFWNAAIGPQRDGQQPAACFAQGLSAVATRLRELAALKMETPRMLVLSTSHVTLSTNDNFNMLTDDVPLFYPKNARGDESENYGWIIPIDPETPWSDMVSADLVAIRELALSSGCTWIMLDRDADVVDALPTYEW